MIFTIKSKKDQHLEELYEKTMKEMGDFFEINWTRNLPKVWLVPDRETINKLTGRETERWVVGWGGAQDGGVYILDSENFEKESDNSYSPEKWDALVKHELIHCFCDVVNGFQRKPKWLTEGISTYLSGQNQWKKSIDKFESFLDSYEEGKSAYTEGGFVVELLIEKYGRKKILELLRKMKEEKTDEAGFAKLFRSIYGIELTYEGFNKLKGK